MVNKTCLGRFLSKWIRFCYVLFALLSFKVKTVTLRRKVCNRLWMVKVTIMESAPVKIPLNVSFSFTHSQHRSLSGTVIPFHCYIYIFFFPIYRKGSGKLSLPFLQSLTNMPPTLGDICSIWYILLWFSKSFLSWGFLHCGLRVVLRKWKFFVLWK